MSLNIYKEIRASHWGSVVITLLSVVLLALGGTNVSKYEGLYRNTILLAIFVLLIPYLRTRKIRPEKRLKRTVIVGLITFLVPIAFALTKPPVTYQQGLKLVSMECDFNYKYIDRAVEDGYSRIPGSSHSRSLFVKDYLYYYVVKTDTEDVYFTVDPITGRVERLSEPFVSESL